MKITKLWPQSDGKRGISKIRWCWKLPSTTTRRQGTNGCGRERSLAKIGRCQGGEWRCLDEAWQPGMKSDGWQLIGWRQGTAADGGLRRRWRDSTADIKACVYTGPLNSRLWNSHQRYFTKAWLTLWRIGGNARYVKLRIAILNLPPIIVCCRQLSLTNPLATADGRNYPSRSLANFQQVENLVTAKQFVVIPLRFRWRPQPSFLWRLRLRWNGNVWNCGTVSQIWRLSG